MRKLLLAGAVGVTTFVCSPQSANAGVVYQTGFESPAYSLGDLIGQNGWSQFDADLPFATVTVQDAVVRPGTGGAQAVQFTSMGPSSDPFTDFTDVWTSDSGVSAALIAAEPIVTIQWDMMRGSTSLGETPTGGWGIDIYDTGSLNVIATVIAYDDNVGPGVSGTDAAGDLVFFGDGTPRGTWDTYTVRLDYTSHTYTVFLNGTQLGSAIGMNPNAADEIGDVDFLAWTRGTDSAYFDNLMISTSPVPEPTSIGALGLVAVTSMKRRRRR